MIYRLFGIGTPPTQRPGPPGLAAPLNRVAAPEPVARDAFAPSVAETSSTRLAEAAAVHQRRGVTAESRATAQHAAAMASGAVGNSPLAGAAVLISQGRQPKASAAPPTPQPSAASTPSQPSAPSPSPWATSAPSLPSFPRPFAAPAGLASSPQAPTAAAPSLLFDDGSVGPDISRLLETPKRPSPAESFLAKSTSLRNAAGPYEVHVARTAALVFKKGFTSWPMGEPGQGLHMIDRTLGEKKDPVIACVRWDTGMQSVVVERSEAGRVHFRGTHDDPRRGALPASSGHQQEGGGLESLPAREFEQRLHALVFPR